MNERIQQLAEQARKYARDYVAECNHYGHYMEQNEYELRFEQTFAELIVRECADIAKGEPASFYDRDAYKLGRKFASEDVLKHFGVEE